MSPYPKQQSKQGLDHASHKVAGLVPGSHLCLQTVSHQSIYRLLQSLCRFESRADEKENEAFLSPESQTKSLVWFAKAAKLVLRINFYIFCKRKKIRSMSSEERESAHFSSK